MALVLYDHPASSNALKVRFALAEMVLAHERRTVPLARPRPDWYLALNPIGGIPALADGDFVLAESHAILRYLAAREGRDDLYPRDPREQARVDEFLDRFHTGLRAALFRHEAAAFGRAPGGTFGSAPPDPREAARVEAEIQPALRTLESVVGADAVVLGRLTIADCALAPVLFRTTLTGLDLTAYPRLTALRAGLTSRPAWAAADPVS